MDHTVEFKQSDDSIENSIGIGIIRIAARGTSEELSTPNVISCLARIKPDAEIMIRRARK